MMFPSQPSIVYTVCSVSYKYSTKGSSVGWSFTLHWYLSVLEFLYIHILMYTDGDEWKSAGSKTTCQICKYVLNNLKSSRKASDKERKEGSRVGRNHGKGTRK